MYFQQNSHFDLENLHHWKLRSHNIRLQPPGWAPERLSSLALVGRSHVAHTMTGGCDGWWWDGYLYFPPGSQATCSNIALLCVTCLIYLLGLKKIPRSRNWMHPDWLIRHDRTAGTHLNSQQKDKTHVSASKLLCAPLLCVPIMLLSCKDLWLESKLGLPWDTWSKRICLAIFWKFRQSESSFQWHCEVRSFQIIQTSVFFSISGRDFWVAQIPRNVEFGKTNCISRISSMWVKQCPKSPFFGGMVTIPSHGWFLALFHPH